MADKLKPCPCRAGRQHLRSKVNGVAGIDLPEGTREALADLEAALDTCDALEDERDDFRGLYEIHDARLEEACRRTEEMDAKQRELAERARECLPAEALEASTEDFAFCIADGDLPGGVQVSELDLEPLVILIRDLAALGDTETASGGADNRHKRKALLATVREVTYCHTYRGLLDLIEEIRKCDQLKRWAGETASGGAE